MIPGAFTLPGALKAVMTPRPGAPMPPGVPDYQFDPEVQRQYDIGFGKQQDAANYKIPELQGLSALETGGGMIAALIAHALGDREQEFVKGALHAITSQRQRKHEQEIERVKQKQQKENLEAQQAFQRAEMAQQQEKMRNELMRYRSQEAMERWKQMNSDDREKREYVQGLGKMQMTLNERQRDNERQAKAAARSDVEQKLGRLNEKIQNARTVYQDQIPEQESIALKKDRDDLIKQITEAGFDDLLPTVERVYSAKTVAGRERDEAKAYRNEQRDYQRGRDQLGDRRYENEQRQKEQERLDKAAKEAKEPAQKAIAEQDKAIVQLRRELAASQGSLKSLKEARRRALDPYAPKSDIGVPDDIDAQITKAEAEVAAKKAAITAAQGEKKRLGGYKITVGGQQFTIPELREQARAKLEEYKNDPATQKKIKAKFKQLTKEEY